MQSGMTYGLCIVVTGGCVCVCCACGGLVSYLAVSFVFVKKTIVPCFFVCAVGFDAFVWYNVAVSLE